MQNISKLFKLIRLYAFITITTASAEECGNLRTQLDMNQCAAGQFQQLDNELNRIYKAYRSRLNDDQKVQFKDAQLAWIKFRDLSCAFQGSMVEGGSVYPFIYQSCLSEKTRLRLKELDSLMHCKEGDLSCPAWN